MIDESRNFIRHPSTVPISFKLAGKQRTTQLRNVGQGGLCFICQNRIAVGEHIDVTIPASQQPFSVHGEVCWCKLSDEGYLVGVCFQKKTDHYAVRMVEQICHIEAYRKQKSAECGREVGSEEAAREWIALYAASFPSIND